ncbi:hypothetical protein [Alteromonas macleodii]|uniref:hypothetical protein n=1 Tax=Alteromonas macleodii TaxID=28108 RepID=UPI001112FDB5|nr:hypothetical protein [Alteromonas macleodii]
MCPADAHDWQKAKQPCRRTLTCGQVRDSTSHGAPGQRRLSPTALMTSLPETGIFLSRPQAEASQHDSVAWLTRQTLCSSATREATQLSL